MRNLIFILGDQLSLNISSLQDFDKNHDAILMAEVWDEAKYACQSLGKGWRLPTLKEMNMIYKIRYKIKGVDTETLGGTFGEVPYWTSNEDVNDPIYAWYKVFVSPGYELTAKKEFKKHVRAVRTMK